MADLTTREDQHVDEVTDPRTGEIRDGDQPTGDDGTGDPAGASVPDGDDSSAPARTSAARSPRSRWNVLMTGLMILLFVLAVTSVLLYVGGTDPVAGRREPALAAARQVALDLSTVGADNAEAQLRKLDEATTGALREEFRGYAPYLPAVLREQQISWTATVDAAGLERIDAERAVALVAVSATATSTEIPDGQLRQYRLAIELRRADSRWLASSIAYIP